MWKIDPSIRHYTWGSAQVLPDFLGRAADGRPWAEAWFGAHPLGTATLEDGTGLDHAIARDPAGMLGEGVARAHDGALPYLLKVIAMAEPLSLQVHPTREHAGESFAAENAAGLAVDSPHRNYRDANHKPELLVALERCEALCGFRTPRKAHTMLEGLTSPLARRMLAILEDQPTAHGMRAAFRMLVHPALSPAPEEVSTLARECHARLEAGRAPSPRIYGAVSLLESKYPGDPGVAAALLLNPVTLQPGEAMYVPAGALHSYLSGVAVEVMASSDNVLRAGLTSKKVDAEELLHCVSVTAAPPIRIGPERLTPTTTAYFAPIDDFELSVTLTSGGMSGTASTGMGLRGPGSREAGLPGSSPSSRVPLPGSGPRIVLCLEGRVNVHGVAASLVLTRGEAAFVTAADGPLTLEGQGRLVQASVP